jgi:hypothetical protein
MRRVPGEHSVIEGVGMRSVTVVSAGAGHYVHWGVLSVSLTNLLIIVAMVVLFALAVVLPFGAGRPDDRNDRSRP